jgi:hypothetical protein
LVDDIRFMSKIPIRKKPIVSYAAASQPSSHSVQINTNKFDVVLDGKIQFHQGGAPSVLKLPNVKISAEKIGKYTEAKISKPPTMPELDGFGDPKKSAMPEEARNAVSDILRAEMRIEVPSEREADNFLWYLYGLAILNPDRSDSAKDRHWRDCRSTCMAKLINGSLFFSDEIINFIVGYAVKDFSVDDKTWWPEVFKAFISTHVQSGLPSTSAGALLLLVNAGQDEAQGVAIGKAIQGHLPVLIARMKHHPAEAFALLGLLCNLTRHDVSKAPIFESSRGHLGEMVDMALKSPLIALVVCGCLANFIKDWGEIVLDAVQSHLPAIVAYIRNPTTVASVLGLLCNLAAGVSNGPRIIFPLVQRHLPVIVASIADPVRGRPARGLLLQLATSDDGGRAAIVKAVRDYRPPDATAEDAIRSFLQNISKGAD